MTKWNVADQRSRSLGPAQAQTHEVWRGIGCLLMLIVPIISYILASLTVTAALAAGWPLPYQLVGNPVMPKALWSVQALAPTLGFIESQTNLYATLLVTVLFSVFLSAVLSFAYSILYRIVGPSRYGPLDAPPPRVSVKTYKR